MTNFNDFQKFFVEHQKNYNVKEEDRLALISLGLAGETGESIELIKNISEMVKLMLQN